MPPDVPKEGRLKIVRDLENHAHKRVSAHTYAHTHVRYYTLDELIHIHYGTHFLIAKASWTIGNLALDRVRS